MIQEPTWMVHGPALGSINQGDGEEVITTQRASNCQLESRGRSSCCRKTGQEPRGQREQRDTEAFLFPKPVTFPCFSSSPHFPSPAGEAPTNKSHFPGAQYPRCLQASLVREQRGSSSQAEAVARSTSSARPPGSPAGWNHTALESVLNIC